MWGERIWIAGQRIKAARLTQTFYIISKKGRDLQEVITVEINRMDFGVGVGKCDNGYKARKNSDEEQGVNNGYQMTGSCSRRER